MLLDGDVLTVCDLDCDVLLVVVPLTDGLWLFLFDSDDVELAVDVFVTLLLDD